MWDPYLTLNFLQFAFKYRRSFDKINESSEFNTKKGLTIFFLVWKLIMSLGQDETINKYTHPYTRHFIRKACYVGRIGSTFRGSESIAIIFIFNVIRCHSNSNTVGI